MKNILYLILLCPIYFFGQTTSKNYIKTLTYRALTATSNAAMAQVDVTYLDGFGRPIQKIQGKASGTGKDLVSIFEYDFFGRQTKEYLPYAVATDNLIFDTIAATNAVKFYDKAVFESTKNPYNETFYEFSPLNRVRKQAAPGTIWQGDAASDIDHTVKFAYQTNTDIEVKKLRAVAGNIVNGAYSISFTSNGNYAAGQLYKTITQNENNDSPVNTSSFGIRFTTEEFKNKQGQVILKRTFNQSEDAYGMPVFSQLDTYYVYDQFGNLTYVLPPIAYGELDNNTCYQYKYDSQNRLVEKKLPGKQWEFIVYDNQDRVAATGPALSPTGSTGNITNGWVITRYDAFGRVACTGWVGVTDATVFNSALRKAKQDEPVTIAIATSTATTIDNITVYYSNLPNSLKLLTVNYYDDYRFLGSFAIPTVETQAPLTTPKGLQTGSWVRILDGSTTAGETSYTIYDRKSRSIRTRITNYLTGYTQTDSKLDFDGTLQYTITKHKRLNSDTNEIVTREDFTYTAQYRLLSQTHSIGSVNPVPQLMSYNTYNDIGQLTMKKVGGTDTTGSTGLQYVDYTYNIRGWLKGINSVTDLSIKAQPQDLFAFKINYTSIPEQDIGGVWACYDGNIAETSWRSASDNIQRRYGYTYDKLNRLTDAWYQIPQATVPVRNSYDEHIRYDINGNITSLKRNGDSDNETITKPIDDLIYTYHNTIRNRLLKVADNITNDDKGFKDSSTNTTDDYTYDLNGNMTSDRNKGITSIIYNHLNLPVKIIFSNGQIEYLYNAAGVKVKKKVTNNQVSPSVSNVDYLGSFQYKDNVLDFFPTSEGYVKNSVVGGANSYNYVFNYTDHLGNVRLSYIQDIDGTLKIMEESHYYPFGLKHTGYNSAQNMISTGFESFPTTILIPVINPSDVTYKYKYNGKELQDELGLNVYDYGWRQYDPAIGRWLQPDPLLNDLNFAFDDSKVDEEDEDEVAQAIITKAEVGDGIYNVDNLNPYVYGYNSPVVYDDPDGRCPACIILALFLLAPEPVMAPTHNKSADWKAFKSARDDKNAILASAVPVSSTTKVATVLYRASRDGKTVNPAKTKTVEKSADLAKAEARASKLSEKQRPGQPMTKAGKEAVKDVNKAKNNGQTVCETCKTNTVPAKQSTRGVTPPKNETHVDHIDPMSKGGSGTPNNGQVLCRDCNLTKSNN